MIRQSEPFRRVVLLAGGVGGARMAEGLALALPPHALPVIANVGDDETFYGLHVSPDVDTLTYTLADRIDRQRGWGVANDATRALGVLAECGAPSWMTLGDKDFGLHIWRSWRLSQGATLTEITEDVGARFAARARVLPVTNDRLRTRLKTPLGWLDFQTWFVRERCAPEVSAITYDGAAQAALTSEVCDALDAADAIIIAPSNPILSIAPMLAIPGLRDRLANATAPCIAISPLIGGKPVKGPLGKLIDEMGLPQGTELITQSYAGLIDGVVIDTADRADAETAACTGLDTLSTDILIPNPQSARDLASRVLQWLASRSAGQLREVS